MLSRCGDSSLRRQRSKTSTCSHFLYGFARGIWRRLLHQTSRYKRSLHGKPNDQAACCLNHPQASQPAKVKPALKKASVASRAPWTDTILQKKIKDISAFFFFACC